MPVIETVLIYVGIPLGIALLLALGVFGRSIKQPHRYRPGKSWDYAPQWFTAHPEVLHSATGTGTGAGSATAVGGASGEW